MNKVLKRGLITLGVIIGILGLLFAGFLFKMNSELSKFNPIETGKLMHDIYVVKDNFANVYFLQDSSKYIVIDCGTDKNIVLEEMKKIGISPDDVSTVFLTHTDQDHIGSLGLFSKAKLYMSKEEQQMINGKKSKFLIFGNSLPRNDYNLIEDHQVIQIGNFKIEGILVPGHTAGMMAYLINDKYLFTGDILSLNDGKITPIPSIFNMDTKQAISSMNIIRNIPTAEYIFTSHWGYTDNYKNAVR